MSVEKQKFEKCRWSIADELEDRYCVCDTSASCGECISISEVCNYCEDFYSEIEQDNLFKGNGNLI